MGPVEQKLRARLNYGLGITYVDAHSIGGELARSILTRLIRDKEVVQRQGNRYTLATYEPDADQLAKEQEEWRRKAEAKKKAQEDALRREAEARRAQEMKAQQERERQQLLAGIGKYRPEEQKVVLAERMAALRESMVPR